LPPEQLVQVLNPAPERGQLSSLRCGLEHLNDQLASLSGIVLTPVDALPAPLDLLHALQEALTAPHQGVIPTFDGAPGHPILLAPDVARLLLHEKDADRLDVFLQRPSFHLRTFPQPHPSVLLNLNRPVDLEGTGFTAPPLHCAEWGR
jgi:CTP:molybdopterin cytidylyltransferase MocA